VWELLRDVENQLMEYDFVGPDRQGKTIGFGAIVVRDSGKAWGE